LYGYANNNPISWIDPEGTSSVDEQGVPKRGAASVNAKSKELPTRKRHTPGNANHQPTGHVERQQPPKYQVIKMYGGKTLVVVGGGIKVDLDGPDAKKYGVKLQGQGGTTQLQTSTGVNADVTPFLVYHAPGYGPNYGAAKHDFALVFNTTNGIVAGAQLEDAGPGFMQEGSLKLHEDLGHSVGTNYSNNLDPGQDVVFVFPGSAADLHVLKALTPSQITLTSQLLFLKYFTANPIFPNMAALALSAMYPKAKSKSTHSHNKRRGRKTHKPSSKD
jgi:hypothetical protein